MCVRLFIVCMCAHNFPLHCRRSFIYTHSLFAQEPHCLICAEQHFPVAFASSAISDFIPSNEIQFIVRFRPRVQIELLSILEQMV